MNPPRWKALRFLPSRTGPDRGARPGLRLDGRGRLDTVHEEDSVRQAILLLLATHPGERLMRPDYGCDLQKVVFQPNDATTAGLAMHYVRQAIDRFEPRVELLRVDANPAPDDPAVLVIDVDFRIRGRAREQSLRFPVSMSGGGTR